MKDYLNLLTEIFLAGEDRDDRTGVGTKSIFGAMMEFDLREGFPIVTTKKLFFKGCTHELKWFLSGDTNIEYLTDHNVHIWDAWADDRGDLGPLYGYQWRNWGGTGIDQIKIAVNTIRNNPHSRRILVSAWNVEDLSKMALAPCHILFQFYATDEYLDIMLYQRSADMFLGVPFNIAEYALLCEIVARCTGRKARYLKYVTGDTHIYKNHIEQVKEQLSRTPRKLPKLIIKNEIHEIEDFDPEMVELEGYDPYPSIKAPVAV